MSLTEAITNSTIPGIGPEGTTIVLGITISMLITQEIAYIPKILLPVMVLLNTMGFQTSAITLGLTTIVWAASTFTSALPLFRTIGNAPKIITNTIKETGKATKTAAKQIEKKVIKPITTTIQEEERKIREMKHKRNIRHKIRAKARKEKDISQAMNMFE